MKKTFRITLVTVVCLLVVASLNASQLMPSFAGVPTGWSTDRYAPASFTNVGTFAGMPDVLGISIDASGDFNNRPAAYRSTFYNTQGDGHAVTGGVYDYISAMLYVPSAWGDAANGNVRTDMWGVLTDGTSITSYPVIGFTNYGGAARYRVWDDTIGAWTNLGTAVAYDQWTTMGITLTSTSIDYSLNGAFAGSVPNSGSTNFSAVIMQAYNFGGDPDIPGANPQPYTAHWANSVPEPTTFGLIGITLAGLGLIRRKLTR